MEKKSNVGLVVGLIISILCVLGLLGYIVYDKVQEKNHNYKLWTWNPNDPEKDTPSYTKNTVTNIVRIVSGFLGTFSYILLNVGYKTFKYKSAIPPHPIK